MDGAVAVGGVGCFDIGELGVEDAGKDEDGRRGSIGDGGGNARGGGDENGREDVSDNHVGDGYRIFEDIGDGGHNGFGRDAVEGDVFTGRAYRHGVEVGGGDRSEAELVRGDGEDAGTATEVGEGL